MGVVYIKVEEDTLARFLNEMMVYSSPAVVKFAMYLGKNSLDTEPRPNLGMIAELCEALSRGEKIRFIKAMRALTEMGLKEAKDFADGFVFPPRESVPDLDPRSDNKSR